MTVILPQASWSTPGVVQPETGFPTLYLLHGLGEDGSSWVRNAPLERYVEGMGLAVVMPQVGKSFYCDEANGNRYWTFLSEDLPQAAQSFFPLSARREDTFVAGLSMGGYGAFKWALRDPSRFSHAASLSGCLDLAGIDGWDETPPWARAVFDNKPIRGTENDLIHLLSEADPAALPKMFQCCGTEDELFSANLVFEQAARERSIALKVDHGPGDHSWTYWDARLRNVLNWLPIGDS